MIVHSLSFHELFIDTQKKTFVFKFWSILNVHISVQFIL